MSENKQKEEEKPIVAKTAVDLQRLKLMKLMKNPDKPVVLPERPKPKNTPTVPEFVRNVMGSSAGAGSGEFHVYRHLRRKEYARQKFIQEKGKKETLEEEYHRKLEENRRLAEELTAKKRAKRLKKKQKWKEKKKMKLNNTNKNSQDEPIEDTESEKEDEEKTLDQSENNESLESSSKPDKIEEEEVGVDNQSNAVVPESEVKDGDNIKDSLKSTDNSESPKTKATE